MTIILMCTVRFLYFLGDVMSEQNTEGTGIMEPPSGQTLMSSMPYADKVEKAEKIARHLIACSELQRETELEVIEEDDKLLADMVKASIIALRESALIDPRKIVHNAEDIDKLPTGIREAVKDLVKQLGGMPEGGLFQVKLDSVAGLDAAVETIIENGNLNLGTIICSKLAAEKSAKITQAIYYLVEYAHTIKEKGKLSAGDKDMLNRIDSVIQRTFARQDYLVAIDLCAEIMKQNKKKTKKPAVLVKGGPKLRSK